MIKFKTKYSTRYANFYRKMADETKIEYYNKKAITLESCFEVQLWDKYPLNKILDNLAHSVCKSRFCLNCQIMSNSKYAHALKPIINDFIKEGMKPYLLTLTVPNCNYEDLKDTILKMNKTYNKLFKKLNAEDKRKWTPRLAKIYGSIKVLEVTVNNEKRTFHPHFHILVLLDDPKYDEELKLNLKPYIQGRYSYKNNDYNYHSNFSIQIMKLWTMLWNEKRITKNSYNNFSSNPNDTVMLEINLTPFEGKDGTPNYLELLKYTSKFDEVYTYEVFKYLELSLINQRRIQTNGCLVGMIEDIEEDEDIKTGEEEELNLEIEEEPEKTVTKTLKELINGEKKEYKKLYRKNTSKYDKEFYTQTVNDLKI